MKRYLSVRPAAKLVGMNHVTFTKYLRQGKIEAQGMLDGKDAAGRETFLFDLEYLEKLRAEMGQFKRFQSRI
jgi:hypothetical protein